MNDLLQTIDWDAIDYSQVLAEDRDDDERNMDCLLKIRAGVQFVPVIEADEIVDGCCDYDDIFRSVNGNQFLISRDPP